MKNINLLLLLRFQLALIVLLLSACYNGDEDAFLEAVEVNELEILSISITPDNAKSVIEIGETVSYIAMADVANSTTDLDVTDRVTWSVSDSAVATIDQAGLVTGVSAGTILVSAALADLDSSETISVSAATLTSLAISSSPGSVRVCTYGHEIELLGTYSDGRTTNDVPFIEWQSSNESVATVDDLGVVSVLTAGGSVDITAERTDVGLNAIATLTIQDNLNSIAVTPSVLVITEEDTQQYTATGTFASGDPADVTPTSAWTVANTDAGASDHLNITSEGLATAVSEGTAEITAGCAGVVSIAATVTVEAQIELNAIEITANQAGPYDLNDSPIELIATLKYSDGSDGDVVTDSDDTDWSVSDVILGESAEVDNIGNDKGMVTFTDEGVTEIRVYYDSDDYGPFQDTIQITVE